MLNWLYHESRANSYEFNKRGRGVIEYQLCRIKHLLGRYQKHIDVEKSIFTITLYPPPRDFSRDLLTGLVVMDRSINQH